MITEGHLEQLALTWFQETGWSYLPGGTIAPDAIAAERVMVTATESCTLAALRDALLSKLLSGELWVESGVPI